MAEARALSRLADALAQERRHHEAPEIARTIEDDSQRAEALSCLASALAQERRFSDALDLLGLRDLYEFFEVLAKRAPCIEQVEQGLSVAVLREATSIAG